MTTDQNMIHKSGKLLIPLLSVVSALLLSSVVIFMTGRNPADIFLKMFRATLGSEYGTGQVVFRMTTLVLAALAIAVPFQLKLFNIGAEGQLQMGAFAAAVTGALLPASTPSAASIPLCIIAAMAAGACWAMLAGGLKVRFGVNEVIATIMLNFIAQGITGYLLTYHFAVPSTEHTLPVIYSASIPTFSTAFGLLKNSPANISFFISIGAALLFYIMLFNSRYGYEMRAVGLQPEASNYGGINNGLHILFGMAIGGASAGLGAVNMVLGYKHYYESGMTGGIGFTGIAVALLAGAHPLWILLSAFFFAVLEYGGLAVNAYIPKDIFMIIQALTIILIISFSATGKSRNTP